VRHGSRQSTNGFLRICAAAVCCASILVGGSRGTRAADPAASDVSPWTTGGAKPRPGDTDGKPGTVKLAQVPVSQAQPWPGYVIQGGAIPKNWQPQPVPYQAIGPDGRPITMYYAPTYTFTYPIGPPVMMASPVNRRQANPQAYGNGWNYQTQGATAPAYTLPPPTVARYQPPPYQFPANASQLGGTPIVPPASGLPQQVAPPPFIQQSPPPNQWVPSASAVPPPPAAPADAAGQMLAAAAPAMIAGGAAAASQASTPPTVPVVPSTPGTSAQPVSSSPLAPVQPPAGRSANSHLWRVVGVHDGDTITCLDENNQQQKIRMAEIDAPELGQDFGKVSRDAMAGMVFGKTVEVVDDGKDRYGRWIGHVFVNGDEVNRQMVATGNAWHYAAYSKDKSLAALQSQAQAERLGLWAQPNPTPPWEYRANGKKNKE
jgi:micrococcal nuclease